MGTGAAGWAAAPVAALAAARLGVEARSRQTADGGCAASGGGAAASNACSGGGGVPTAANTVAMANTAVENRGGRERGAQNEKVSAKQWVHTFNN